MSEKRIIAENAADAIVTVDQDDCVLTWNPAAERMFGWSFEEALGRRLGGMIFPEHSLTVYLEGLTVYRNTGVSPIIRRRMAKTVLHRDGWEFPAEIYIAPSESRTGTSFVLYARDISPRLRREEKIKRAYQNLGVTNAILRISLEEIPLMEMLDRILDTILNGITIRLLPRGAILLVNESVTALTLTVHRGFSEELTTLCSRVPFGRCHCGRAAASRVIQYVDCVDSRHDIRVLDMAPHGHYCVPICSGDNILGVLALYIEEKHENRPDEEDILLAIANILAGIIERKKIEEQRSSLIDSLKAIIIDLMDEKKFTESIIQSLRVGLIVLDLEGRIVTSNNTAKEILSQFADSFSVVGRRLSEVVGLVVADTMTIAQGVKTTYKPVQAVLKSRKGEERLIEFTTVPRVDSSGKQVGLIVSFSDMTEFKYFQREMEKMNRLSTVAEIASAVAHEVRNPLAGIRTMSQSIDENLPESDENREYTRRIIKQVDRLNDLLTEFFTYAKPGKPKKRSISLLEVIRETKPLLKVKLGNLGIILREEYEASLPNILADFNQIQQVFLNLLLNSLDAVGAGGAIEISARSLKPEMRENFYSIYPGLRDDREYVVVFFSDNGPGMSEEVIEKAFEPFFTTKHTGSGLGLSIVYRILLENNAVIFIDTAKSDGTTFIMFFEAIEHGKNSNR